MSFDGPVRVVEDDQQTLSNFTYNQNQALEEQIQKITNMERIKQSMNQPYANISRVNCSEKLQNAAREFKCMNYRLRRLISNDDAHMSLAPGKPLNEIEVIESTYMFFRVNTSGQFAPARLIITYAHN